MKKKYFWIIISIILILLLFFFYPKECGRWGTAIHPNATYKDCTCIGMKYTPQVGGGAYISCFGIPTSTYCYYYQGEGTGENWKVEKIEVSCNSMECENNGGKCYNFGDFIAEGCEDHGMVKLPYECPVMAVNTQCCSYGE